MIANGSGWSARGLQGPAPAPQSCHASTKAYQAPTQPLPDPQCTPGAIDPTVVQTDVRQTICRAGGYTSSVRPPPSVTGPAKKVSLRGYGLSGSAAAYEFDHLVPLGLGGASDWRNLWPESRQEFPGAGEKDELESYLHDQVCARTMTLGAAQRAIATDWVAAYCAARLTECADGAHLVQAAVRPGASAGD